MCETKVGRRWQGLAYALVHRGEPLLFLLTNVEKYHILFLCNGNISVFAGGIGALLTCYLLWYAEIWRIGVQMRTCSVCVFDIF